MSTNTNLIGSRQSTNNVVTPRQLVSIKAISASLDIDAKSECLRLFDCDLRALTVTSAARLISELRARLIRKEARNNEDYEFPMERPIARGSVIEG